MTMQILINLPQILIWPMRPDNVSHMCQTKVVLTNESMVMGQSSCRNFCVMLYEKMGWWEFFAHYNGWGFSKLCVALILAFIHIYIYINLNLQRPVKMG